MQNIEYYISSVNKLFKELSLPSVPINLYAPVEYTLSLSGKRLRPLLCILSCDICCGNIEKAGHAALALELFHNFTLLHDDIMDKAPIRRGKPTVYKKWNSDTAILSGDAMFAMAYNELSKSASEHLKGLLALFSKTAVEVCEGQQYDKDFESLTNVSEQDYLEMIRLKTSVLIAASMQMGAIIGGANCDLQKKFYDFGIKTGLAFQIQDDLLDTYGNESKFGKKTGGDIEANKKTYLYVIAHKNANEVQRHQLEQLFTVQDVDIVKKINSVLNIFNDLDVEAKTKNKLNQYFEEALDILYSMEISEEAKGFIKNFTQKLISREF